MNRYIVFGITSLMAFALNASAQDANADDAGKKSERKVVSQYNTRVVKGSVLDAATGKPLAGAIVRANEIDGYSALTDDNGAYELKVPDFATAVAIFNAKADLPIAGLAATIIKSELFRPDVFLSKSVKPVSVPDTLDLLLYSFSIVSKVSTNISFMLEYPFAFLF